MNSQNKIQCQLINHLLKNGTIDLLLPDGVKLSIGITQETKKGIVKDKEYCWVHLVKNDKHVNLDRYSLAVDFDIESCCIINEESGMVEII